MALAENISRQPSIDSIMSTAMQIHNENEQSEQGKLENTQFEKKRGTRT